MIPDNTTWTVWYVIVPFPDFGLENAFLSSRSSFNEATSLMSNTCVTVLQKVREEDEEKTSFGSTFDYYDSLLDEDDIITNDKKRARMFRKAEEIVEDGMAIMQYGVNNITNEEELKDLAISIGIRFFHEGLFKGPKDAKAKLHKCRSLLIDRYWEYFMEGVAMQADRAKSMKEKKEKA